MKKLLRYYHYQPSRTLKDPEVFKHLYKCKFQNLKKNDVKSLFKEYVDTYKAWLSEGSDIQLIGLDKFPYVYFTSGVCGAIEAVIACSRYKWFSGISNDFPYYKFAVKTGGKNWLLWPQQQNTSNVRKTLLFLSNPQYKTGIFETDMFQPYIKRREIDIFYDMAYIGCCLWKGKITIPDKCAFCAFSLSKAFGLENYRLGILFSRHELPWLEALHQTYYLNIQSLYLAIHLMKKFSLSYIPNKYRKAYEYICKKHLLRETDSPWIALSKTNEKKFISHLYNEKKISESLAETCK